MRWHVAEEGGGAAETAASSSDCGGSATPGGGGAFIPLRRQRRAGTVERGVRAGSAPEVVASDGPERGYETGVEVTAQGVRRGRRRRRLQHPASGSAGDPLTWEGGQEKDREQQQRRQEQQQEEEEEEEEEEGQKPAEEDVRVGEGARVGDSELGKVRLADYYNSQYVGDVGVGSPPQMLSVVLDTGSSDLWIPGKGCTACGNHATFDSARSDTYEMLLGGDGQRRMFEVDYGSGLVQGFTARDQCTLGEGLTLEGVSFGEVMFEDQQIRSFMMDGIAGLGFSGLSMVTTPTLLELLHATYPDVPFLFSVYLSNDPLDEDKPSHIAFGAYDLGLVSPNASWQYTPLVRHSFGQLRYWTVAITSIDISFSHSAQSSTTSSSSSGAPQKVSARACEDNSCVAIVDTGTSGIAIPEDLFVDVLMVITQGLDCRGTSCFGVDESAFPSLLFGVYPDNVFPIRAEDYVVCSRFGECLIKLQPSFGGRYWILGDVFLQAYYSVFDVENLRIGFACTGECSGGDWHGRGGFLQLGGEEGGARRDALWWSRWALGAALLAVAAGVVWVLVVYVPPLVRSCLRERRRRRRRQSQSQRLSAEGKSSPRVAAEGEAGSGQEGEGRLLAGERERETESGGSGTINALYGATD